MKGSGLLFLQLSRLVLIITSYRREVQMFRKAQWNELYYTHSKSQWVERFVHRLKTSFWLRSSNHVDSCHVDSCWRPVSQLVTTWIHATWIHATCRNVPTIAHHQQLQVRSSNHVDPRIYASNIYASNIYASNIFQHLCFQHLCFQHLCFHFVTL